MPKQIKIDLFDPSSIDKAVEQVEYYKQELLLKCTMLQNKIASDLGAKIRQGFTLGSIDVLQYGGTLNPSVDVVVDKQGEITVVMVLGEDAVFVEFGAGVYYNGGAGSSPHPLGGEFGMLIGEYGYHRGRRNVWGYYDGSGNAVLTRGTPAQMPIYKSVQLIAQSVYDIAKGIFR